MGDVPSLIVFSDMQFDQASGYGYYGTNSTRTAMRMETMHEVIKGKFVTVGRRLGWNKDSSSSSLSEAALEVLPPPIVYWNLRNCGGGGHPVESDTQGTVLLSGFSPSMLKLVLNGEVLEKETKQEVVDGGVVVVRPERVTPAEILRKSLDESLYDPVRAILLESREGILAEYQHQQNDEQSRTEGMEDDFEMVVHP